MDAMEKLDSLCTLPKVYCDADDLLQLPPPIPALSVGVEISNLSEKVENLQREVSHGLMELKNSMKSVAKVGPEQEDNPARTLTTPHAKSRAIEGEDLA